VVDRHQAAHPARAAAGGKRCSKPGGAQRQAGAAEHQARRGAGDPAPPLDPAPPPRPARAARRSGRRRRAFITRHRRVRLPYREHSPLKDARRGGGNLRSGSWRGWPSAIETDSVRRLQFQSEAELDRQARQAAIAAWKSLGFHAVSFAGKEGPTSGSVRINF